MKPAIILLTILVLGGAVVWLIDKLFYRREAADAAEAEAAAAEEPTPTGCADEGCGLRTVCPTEQLLAGQCATKPIYYDDEELDLFAGRTEDGYTPEEMEQWRDVLYTLQPSDLLGWGQSIKHRGLVMPSGILEEFLQLASEYRSKQGSGQ